MTGKAIPTPSGAIQNGEWTPESLGGQRLEALDQLREAQDEVTYNPTLGWTVYRYDAIVEAANDHESFSNVRLNIGESQPLALRNIPLEYDPPEHTVYRNLLKPLFTPMAVVAHEAMIRALAQAELPKIVTGASEAVIENFADPFPVRVLCNLIGWHQEDWRFIKQMSENQRVAMTERNSEKLRAAHQAWSDYIMPVVGDRRIARRDDLTSWLLDQEIDGRKLDDRELLSIIRFMLVAGHGTTSASTGILIAYLAENPDAQAQLRERPELISRAIEEILRCRGPLAGMQRTATRDLEFHGANIRKGDRVALMFSAGNRDPRRFEAPDEVRFDRPPGRHLVLGVGVHNCLGASLARLQLRTILTELLTMTSEIRLDGAPPKVRPGAWPTNDLEEFRIVCLPR